jgi:hypothetical protein
LELSRLNFDWQGCNMHASITGDKHNYLVPSRGCISQHMKLAEFISKMPVSAPFPTSKVREAVAPIEDQAVVGFWYWAYFFKILKVTQWAGGLALCYWRLNLNSLFNRKPCANLLRPRSRGDFVSNVQFWHGCSCRPKINIWRIQMFWYKRYSLWVFKLNFSAREEVFQCFGRWKEKN